MNWDPHIVGGWPIKWDAYFNGLASLHSFSNMQFNLLMLIAHMHDAIASLIWMPNNREGQPLPTQSFSMNDANQSVYSKSAVRFHGLFALCCLKSTSALFTLFLSQRAFQFLTPNLHESVYESAVPSLGENPSFFTAIIICPLEMR